MPQESDNSAAVISKEADAAARAAREKLFKAESARIAQHPKSLAQAIRSLTGILGAEHGQVPREVVDSFDVLREEMLKVTPSSET